MTDVSAEDANEAGTVLRPDLIALLLAHPVFGRLGSGALADLVAAGHPMHVPAGDTLMRQGEAGDCALLVVAGELEVFVETPYGPVAIATLAAGQLLGELGAIAGMPRTASVRSRSAAELLRIDADVILALGRRHPDLLIAVIRILGERIATIGSAIGFYTQALAALERQDFDVSILDHLLHPVPELRQFEETFRRMAEQIIERRRHFQEMASATAIQRAMLPPPAPDPGDPRTEIFAAIRPAREVGGDLYNYFPLDAERIAIVIGDVSGKGVPASLFMAITQTVTRIALAEIDDLATAIGRANAFLCAENKESMFATLFCGVLDLRSGALAYANCGHNPPFLLRSGGGSEDLPVCGPALGILGAAKFRPRSVVLGPGDRLFLYTDGVTEATDAAGELFGDERLEAACRALGDAAPQPLVESVIRAVDEFAGAQPQFDDITCLALRYRGSRPE